MCLLISQLYTADWRGILHVLATVVLLKILHLTITNLVDRWHFRNLPGLRNDPIIGSSFQVKKAIKNKDPIDLLDNLCKRFENEPMWTLWIGLTPIVFIQSGATMQPILTSSSYLGKAYDEAKEFFGDGLFISSGKKWHTRRKLLTPAFHIDVIKSFKDQIHEHVMNTVEYIAKQDGAPFDIQARLGESTFANLLDTQFGFGGGWSSSLSQELRKEYFFALRTLLINHGCKTRSIACKIPILRYFTTIMATERKYKQTLIKITKTVIATKIEQRSKETVQPARLLNLLIDELEQPTSGITIEDVVDEVNAFVAAGFDTSTSALTWIFFQLALNQQVQDKLRKELLDKFRPEMVLSLDELNSLVYLECVVKECMRLYSPVPIVARRDHAIVVPVNDGKTFTLPANTEVRLLIGGVNKNKIAWGEDAELFDPERFLDPARDARNKHCFNFIPFSAGPRNCIGRRYAYFVIKAFMAHLLMNFRFKTHLTRDTVKLSLAGTLFAKDGLFVIAEKLV
ncbi:Cytochrome P450 4d2 [Cichlidogyrus casuarinus]|uniref:Cytochrome P450 4d2 n=1 Tax=Cichlidogyrus casuarinus TaxID=1844966 RepID=A0ABD2PL66_9PLAT